MVIASHGVTEARAKAVTSTEPHDCSGGVIIAKTDAIKTAADLTGKTVAVPTGTTCLDNVEKLADVEEMKNFAQHTGARTALMTGRVDAWVTDRFVARSALARPVAGLQLHRRDVRRPSKFRCRRWSTTSSQCWKTRRWLTRSVWWS